MLPEISPGSYFAPQVRYGIDFEGNDDGRMLRQLRFAPTLSINLPHRLFFTLYPSPDIRLNYGTPVWNQTGRLFLPLNFMLGWKPTEHIVISAEFGIPRRHPPRPGRLKPFGAADIKASSTACTPVARRLSSTANRHLLKASQASPLRYSE
jgi:hypothetical protein